MSVISPGVRFSRLGSGPALAQDQGVDAAYFGAIQNFLYLMNNALKGNPMLLPEYIFQDVTLLCRAVGLVGFSVYVIGFFGLCTGRLSSATPRYFCLTFVASTCVMISLMADFNLSAALIQGFYIIMSLGGIALRKRRHEVAAI